MAEKTYERSYLAKGFPFSENLYPDKNEMGDYNKWV